MKLEWNDKALQAAVEKIMIENSWTAAQAEAERLRNACLVYHGPPRANGRIPGTMRDGIVAKKLRKWSRVEIPHPAVFVEYGGEDDRAPKPFIRPTFELMKDHIESLYKESL